MWVVQQLHNLHFSVNLLQVGGIESGFIDDLYGHLKKKKRYTQTGISRNFTSLS